MMHDTAGFTSWARANQGLLLRAAYLVSGDSGRAEDLVQEALTKVALKWPVEHPLAYARTIIYRDQVSWWRRRRVAESPAESAPEASQWDAPVEARLVVAQALRKLSLRQRQVLVLRYFEDLSEAESAAVLGISVGTVKRTTHDAVAALRAKAPELQNALSEV